MQQCVRAHSDCRSHRDHTVIPDTGQTGGAVAVEGVERCVTEPGTVPGDVRNPNSARLRQH